MYILATDPGSGSSDVSFGHTITEGIQDISALLPLLGTEQCETHVASALADGYLYAAATPLSIFGSLGMAKAAFKALMASVAIPRWNFVGGEKLRDAGFAPAGKCLSLVMMDPNGSGCHLAETHLDALLRTLNIEDVGKLKIKTTNGVWNVKMGITTIFFCTISVAPYIHLNLDGNTLPASTGWTFPVIRALGGFLAASSIQILIQRRLIDLINKRLIFRILDPLVYQAILKDSRFGVDNPLQWDSQSSAETCLWSLGHYLRRNTSPTVLHQTPLGRAVKRSITSFKKWCGWTGTATTVPVNNPIAPTDIELGKLKHQRSLLDDLQSNFTHASKIFPASPTIWPFALLIALGIVACVVGYVGCFSVVQGAKHARGPIIWLSLEAVLSILRIVLWSWNPVDDNPDPIKFLLDIPPMLSTCNKPADEVFKEKVLPLVPASNFLELVRLYGGLSEPFGHPDLTLYYTLTRMTASEPGIHERTLFITLVDHKTNKTSVYHEGAMNNANFWSARTISTDAQHGVSHTIVGDKLEPAKDPLAGNNNIRIALHRHYRSILELLQFRDIHWKKVDEVPWTLKIAGAPSQDNTRKGMSMGALPHNSIAGPGFTPIFTGSNSQVGSIIPIALVNGAHEDDIEYFRQGNLQRKSQSLFKKKGDWITHYVWWVSEQGTPRLREIKSKISLSTPEVMRIIDFSKWMNMDERLQMEWMLVDEMQQWQESLLEEHKKMMNAILARRNSKDLEKSLKDDWVASCWVRLKGNEDLVAERLAKSTPPRDFRVAGEMGALWDTASTELQEMWKFFTLMYADEGCFTTTAAERSQKRQLLYDMATGVFKSIAQHMQTLEHQGDNGGNGSIQKIYQDNQSWRQARFQNEINLSKDLLTGGLANCPDLSTPSATFALFALHTSKWTEVRAQRMRESDSEAILNGLRRNGETIFVEFQSPESDHTLAKAIELVRDVVSLTTLSFGHEFRIPDLTFAALEETVGCNYNITSVCGVDPRLESIQQMLANRHSAHNKYTSISLYGFGLSRAYPNNDTLFAREASAIELTFVGPKTGNLTLKLHHGSGIAESLQINSKTLFVHELECQESFITDNITLLPSTHFDVGCLNIISVVPSSCNKYWLRDVDLLDENGRSYRDPDDGPQISGTSGGITANGVSSPP